MHQIAHILIYDNNGAGESSSSASVVKGFDGASVIDQINAKADAKFLMQKETQEVCV